jgi:hypothetical protein
MECGRCRGLDIVGCWSNNVDGGFGAWYVEDELRGVRSLAGLDR